ncbi:hypothetical protein RND81_02G122300 [Saponaria officinalis]|uniref:Uncharacterized protein n=1 Tax=Saponaria officinalis TaxID=3572 RepID=A0AAW1MTU7_SAPOF
MGRTPCCDKQGMKKGPWSSEEDEILINYINKNGHGNWRSLPKNSGLQRCGKSCRLRWTNYLRPDIKRGPFTLEEEKLVMQLHAILGNRWAAIAAQLPGRTDNEIKNLWNTHLRKRLVSMGLDPQTHEPTSTQRGPSTKPPASSSTRHMAQWESARLEAEARLSRESLIYNPNSSPFSDSDLYLKLWNSEVGESFRKVGNVEIAENENTCQSPVSQASSSTKCASVSGLTIDTCQASVPQAKEDSKSDVVRLNARSDSSCSNEIDNSSESALQLLLNFPGNDDMGFWEEDINDYSIYPSILSND